MNLLLRPFQLLVLACLLASCGPEPESASSSLVAVFRAEDGALTEGTRGEFFVGRADPGSTLEVRILLKNVGEAPVQLAPIDWLGGTSAAFTVEEPVALALEPGSQTELAITFQPPRAGRFVSTLRVSTAKIKLVGVGETTLVTTEPRLILTSDGPLDFGAVPYFASYPISSAQRVWFIVEDEPNAPSQVIDRISVEPMDGEGSAAELEVSIDEAPSELPPNVPEGARRVELRMTPSSVGAKRWSVTLHAVAPIAPVSFEVRAEALVADACELVPSTTTLSFGVVPPEETRELELQFTNEGEGPAGHCLVAEVGLTSESSPAFTVSGAFEEPMLLGPGEAFSVNVRYDPSAEPSPTGPELTGFFSVRTNSSARPVVEVPIAAVISAPSCVHFTLALLDFGKQNPGCSSSTRTFEVTNSCLTSVTLTSFQVTDPAGQPADEFLLISSPAIPAGGLELRPGEPVSFQIKYRPFDLGADTGTFEITTRMGSTPGVARLTLAGMGDPLGTYTDTWFKSPPEEADILLVIDDSPSMADDQVSLASNLNAYLSFLQGQYLDFRLAVISASASAGAVLRSGPTHPDLVLERTTPNLEAQFAQKVNVGTSGSGGPSCLDQALTALSQPLLDGPNAGVLRPDAYLAVICITDSADLSPHPVSEYVSSFWDIKGYARNAMFTFNVIGGVSASCPGDSGLLRSTASQTGGWAGEICDPTWSAGMDYRSRFGFPTMPEGSLTSLPDLSKGPIEVKVDGVLLPPTDAQGNTVWTYNSVANSIDFAPNFLPQPGQRIEVTYFSTCY